ncbi:MAG: hypothetical protein AAB337_01130 [Patescibacteria group bacterium]
MSIESKIRRPMPFGRPDEPMPIPPKKSRVGKFFLILFVLALIAAAIYFGKTYLFESPDDLLGDLQGTTGESIPVVEGTYYAVFLDNSQVYFGLLDDRDGDFYRLTDVFYLDTRQNPQDTSAGAGTSLVKLGNEAHGPQDYMDINKDHILFIEEMKPDSKVVQAIAQYKSGE